MLYKAQRYAEAHPQERIWIVCATEAHAQMLKANWRREYGVGTNNVEFINLNQATNAYSHTTYKVFWDHYAAEEQMTKDIHRAGFVRNKQMVDTMPDLCYAFIKNNSKGATMCAKLAEDAGISTIYFRE